jgi:hypothetical protein
MSIFLPTFLGFFMKTLIFRNATFPPTNCMLLVAVLLSADFPQTALAHTANGALKAAAGSVDVYETSCSKNSAGATGMFSSRVKATKAGAIVSIQASKGKLASQATDIKGGNAVYSAVATLKGGGEGIYTLLVDKSNAGVTDYVLEAHCETTTGNHTDQTEPVLVQNQ